MHFQTRCVHTGVDKDSAYNSVITPIYPSSTFFWDDLQTHRGYDYTRSGNPTRLRSKRTSRPSKEASPAAPPPPAWRRSPR